MRTVYASTLSPEAISKWEQDRYQPGPDKLKKLEEQLELSLYTEDGSLRNARLYDEDHMSAFLKGKLNAGDFPEAAKAMVFAKEKHAGSWRKPEEARIPYINHPLTMACHAFAMGLENDALLAAVLLHDVVEDCGVRPDELPVSPEVQEVVSLVSKPQKPYSEKEYYKMFKDLFLLSVANVAINVLLSALGIFGLGGIFY